jgi:glycosyltransferase involved in cell wall biosynthesis
MKKILDVGFGRKTLCELYKSTQMSSRLLYGMAQLEDRYLVEHVSWEPFSLKGLIMNNIRVLHRCDVVFLAYLYMQPILLLALLRRIGFFRNRQLIAVSHVSLRSGRNWIETLLLRFAYGAFSKILFHSPQNMEESVSKKLISSDKCEVLLWGDDLTYIDRNVIISQGDKYLSTGREHRDFQTLISAFAKLPNISVEIFTNLYNYDNDYTSIKELKGKYSNVEVEFVEKSTETTRYLAQKAGGCKCVVVSVEKAGLYYCIGLTSVIEAMAMAKPVISTRNPYYPFDIEKENIGLWADNEEEWIKAIELLHTNPQMAEEMGKNGRKLAEEKYNIVECSKQIDRLINYSH